MKRYLFEIKKTSDGPVYKLREIYEDDKKAIEKAWKKFRKIKKKNPDAVLEISKKAYDILSNYVVESMDDKYETAELIENVALPITLLVTGGSGVSAIYYFKDSGILDDHPVASSIFAMLTMIGAFLTTAAVHYGGAELEKRRADKELKDLRYSVKVYKTEGF